MALDLREGYVEHITKSSDEGGRELSGYIVLVRVPGCETYEVGLAELRRILGWRQLNPQRVKALMDSKPEMIAFSGKDRESGVYGFNTLQIIAEAAVDWAERAQKLMPQGL